MQEACEEAYEKMNNVLIDDRRIKVDFCQSVGRLWNQYKLKTRERCVFFVRACNYPVYLRWLVAVGTRRRRVVQQDLSAVPGRNDRRKKKTRVWNDQGLGMGEKY